MWQKEEGVVADIVNYALFFKMSIGYDSSWSPNHQSIKLVLEACNGLDNGCADYPSQAVIDGFNDNYQLVVNQLSSYNKLVPADPYLRQEHQLILEHFNAHIQPYFEKSLLLENPSREGLDLFFESLAFIENVLTRVCGSYFGGDQPNFVDYGIFPYLDKVGKWIPAPDSDECPLTQAWLDRMRAQPVVVRVMTSSHDDESSHCQLYLNHLRTCATAKC